MFTRQAGGNISGEATTPFSNISAEAMRHWKTLSVHQRRPWLDCWSLGCHIHGTPLSPFKGQDDEPLEVAARAEARLLPRLKSSDSPWARSILANGGQLTPELQKLILPRRYRKPFLWPPERPHVDCGWYWAPLEQRSGQQPSGLFDIGGWLAGYNLPRHRIIVSPQGLKFCWTDERGRLTEAARAAIAVIQDLMLFVASQMKPSVATLLARWDNIEPSVWSDDSGQPLSWREVTSPRGTHGLRTRALSLAIFIWQEFLSEDFRRLANRVPESGPAGSPRYEPASTLGGVLLQQFGLWRQAVGRPWTRDYEDKWILMQPVLQEQLSAFNQKLLEHERALREALERMRSEPARPDQERPVTIRRPWRIHARPGDSGDG
jgi:hypothetical protein